MRGRSAALALAATLALAGCGGSDESGEDVLNPTTVPTTTTPTTPTTATPTAPSATTPEPGATPYSTEEQAPGEGGGTPSAPRGDGETGGARPPEDSAENDTAPDPDSPAGRYEQYCNDNPTACE